MNLKPLLVCALLGALPSFARSETVVKISHLQTNQKIIDIWKEAAQTYEKDHPGVKIEFNYLENEAFKAKLPTLLQSKDRPSAFHSWGGGVMYEQVEFGHLSGYHRSRRRRRFSDTFYPATIQNFTVDGKTYGLPNDLGPIVFWYNKELCQKAGVDPTKIQYWEDFVEAVKKCQAAGVTPVAVGGKDKWPLHFYPTFLMMRILGRRACVRFTKTKTVDLPALRSSKPFSSTKNLRPCSPFRKGTCPTPTRNRPAPSTTARRLSTDGHLGSSRRPSQRGGQKRVAQRKAGLDFLSGS